MTWKTRAFSQIVVLNTHGTPESGHRRRLTVCVPDIDTHERTGVNRLGSRDAAELNIWAESSLRDLVIENNGFRQADHKIIYVTEETTYIDVELIILGDHPPHSPARRAYVSFGCCHPRARKRPPKVVKQRELLTVLYTGVLSFFI